MQATVWQILSVKLVTMTGVDDIDNSGSSVQNSFTCSNTHRDNISVSQVKLTRVVVDFSATHFDSDRFEGFGYLYF